MENRLNDFIQKYSEWSDRTFGSDRKPQAPLHHLKEEVAEAIEALDRYDEMKAQGLCVSKQAMNVMFEFADIFILALDAPRKYGLDMDKILDLAEVKLFINERHRTWGKPDENGVIKHVEETEENISEELRFFYSLDQKDRPLYRTILYNIVTGAAYNDGVDPPQALDSALAINKDETLEEWVWRVSEENGVNPNELLDSLTGAQGDSLTYGKVTRLIIGLKKESRNFDKEIKYSESVDLLNKDKKVQDLYELIKPKIDD